MEFMLTFSEPAETVERYGDPATAAAAMAPWMAYMGEMAGAGVLRGGNQLKPAWTATTPCPTRPAPAAATTIEGQR